ncbi:unnamed protein product [Dovyalis caffra]|uniref:Iron-related transcription factor 3 bHLH domain-containing protein n=1 Tax=Dovyalis caffra TaxID=77055 RepID=A0AAV1QNM4_9ROSI|nr:unnamed protein product [Dovyalis caffra]
MLHAIAPPQPDADHRPPTPPQAVAPKGNLFIEVSMGSELNVRVDEVTENSCLPTEKSKRKASKRIHKAEREKLKREQLNELFDELVSALRKFLFNGNF